MHPKVYIQFPAGAFSVIVAYVIASVLHVNEPVEVVAAQTALIAFLAGYLTPGGSSAAGTGGGG